MGSGPNMPPRVDARPFPCFAGFGAPRCSLSGGFCFDEGRKRPEPGQLFRPALAGLSQPDVEAELTQSSSPSSRKPRSAMLVAEQGFSLEESGPDATRPVVRVKRQG
jgi:hypothetical protein